MPARTPEFAIAHESTVGEILNYCLNLHQQFDSLKWRRPSFHNKLHVLAVLKATTIYFKALESGRDPLSVRKHLELWNYHHKGAEIKNLDELLEVMTIAIACHDLGNFMIPPVSRDKALNEHLFLDRYCACNALYKNNFIEDDAEARSSRLAMTATTMLNLHPDKIRRYIPLVIYLIHHTRYQNQPKNNGEPFSEFMPSMDQAASTLINNGEQQEVILKSIIGLMFEQVWENPSFEDNPRRSMNFIVARLPKLIPNEEKRAELYEIFNLASPPSNLESLAGIPFPDQKLKISDWLRKNLDNIRPFYPHLTLTDDCLPSSS
jgi:hypothetical protein